MVRKRDIINALFVSGFPVYGIGSYWSAAKSPSIGYVISIFPMTIILVFYLIDILYKREFVLRINLFYGLMMLFSFSCVASLFVALHKNLPEINFGQSLARSVIVLVPFQAFVVTRLYNDNAELLSRLMFIGMSLLLFIDLIGYFGFGLSNEVHSIEGRINFPFLDGLYSGSALVAILTLMLLYYFPQIKFSLVLLACWIVYLFINFTLLFLINSRLTILIFLVVFFLHVFKLAARAKSVYWISLFTVPILLSSGMLIYQILNAPVFSSILQRVDIIDVTTFNGRSYLWQDAIDWLLYDRQGLLFGNGYRGHYFFYLISDVAEMWNEKDLQHLHLHSTSLEMLVCQGLISYVIFLILFYKVFQYCRLAYHKTGYGVFLLVVLFLLFITQVDMFLYMESLGAVIFAFLAALVAVRENPVDIAESIDEDFDKNNRYGLHRYPGL